MTTIAPTGSATASTVASSTASATSSTTVDYNTFLQLLVQEMQNQDPTAPTDPTQFMSQIATFSNVEQGVNMNNKLATLLTNSSLTQAETVIGKNVTSADGTVSGTVSSVALASDGSATATLASGKTLTLDSTVSFSTAAPSTSSTTAS